MPLVGLISGGDEFPYRDDVLKLSQWCSVNNQALNTKKKLKRASWTSKATEQTYPPPSASNANAWRGCVLDLPSWTPLSLLTSPGLLPPWLSKRHNSVCISWECLGRKCSVRGWWWPSTSPPLRAYWHTASHVWLSHCMEFDRKKLQKVVKAAPKSSV